MADYPELKSTLLKLLYRYRVVVAAPGEPLGVTNRAEHNIRLKLDTKPMYRFPHSPRQIVRNVGTKCYSTFPVSAGFDFVLHLFTLKFKKIALQI